jgi:hypothetical protein
MPFAIMRCKKLSTAGSVASALQHCYRERETPNADAARTPGNEQLESSSSDKAMGKLRALLPEKRRKDAVLAIEYVLTASPEWWKSAKPGEQSEFFSKAWSWLAEKYGPDRVIAASVHRDELTPHLSAFVVPLTVDGRLSAKEFIGDRKKMRLDQTRFHEAVKHLGLERGIKGSRANHQRVQAHYAAIERGRQSLPVIEVDALTPVKSRSDSLLGKLRLVQSVETPEGVAERLTRQVRVQVAPAVAAASTAFQAHQRVKELQQTAKEQAATIEKLRQPFQGLSRDQVAEILRLSLTLQDKNRREKEAKLEAQRGQRLERQKDRGHDRGGFER